MNLFDRWRGEKTAAIPEAARVRDELSALLNQRERAVKELEKIQERKAWKPASDMADYIGLLDDKILEIKELDASIVRHRVLLLPLLRQQKADLQQTGKNTRKADVDIALVESRINQEIRRLDILIQGMEYVLQNQTRDLEHSAPGESSEISERERQIEELKRQRELLFGVLEGSN